MKYVRQINVERQLKTFIKRCDILREVIVSARTWKIQETGKTAITIKAINELSEYIAYIEEKEKQITYNKIALEYGRPDREFV